MKKLRFTNKAVEDLTQIWDHTLNKWSENQADIYYSLLIENCKEISSNPGMGNKYSRITEGLFGRKKGKHIIFYREVAENTSKTKPRNQPLLIAAEHCGCLDSTGI